MNTFYLNSRTDAGRRNEIEWRLEQAGLEARRFAVPAWEDVERVMKRRQEARRLLNGLAQDAPATIDYARALGMRPETQDCKTQDARATIDYARALGMRLLLRRARREKMEAVRIVDDGAAFHPNFAQLAAVIEPPDDWEIFHLGHTFLDDEPEPVAAGVVRVRKGTGFHAFAVRAGAMTRLARVLSDWCRRAGTAGPLDAALAAAQEEFRTYACFPNLAWHDPDAHIAEKAGQAGYGIGGTQTVAPENARRLYHAMFASGRSAEFPGPAAGRTRLALMFLTKGDTHHPEIWREYVAQAPDRVRVFSHPKNPRELAGGFLEGTAIEPQIATAWGDVSLVRATLALLHAALADSDLTHFALVSESCVPVRPLTEVLKLLDWNPRSRFVWRDLTNASPTQRRRALDLPQVPESCWRFQSQWWLLERTAAEWVARADYTDVFQKMEVPDEGYFSTVLCLLGFPLDDFVEKAASTWTRWEGGPHPLSHEKLADDDLRSILESGALFARKFPKGADVGRFGLHHV
jgi:hypothetical protein